MATEQLPITRGRAAAMLRAVVAASPDAVNPRADTPFSACVYTTRDGTGHCAVGQLLTDADLPCPVWDDAFNGDEFGVLPPRFLAAFTREAANAIAGWQTAFDRCDAVSGEHTTWGQALAQLEDEGILP